MQEHVAFLVLFCFNLKSGSDCTKTVQLQAENKIAEKEGQE